MLVNIKRDVFTTYDQGIAKPPNLFEFLSIQSQLLALTKTRTSANNNVRDDNIEKRLKKHVQFYFLQ